ncbi:MAG: ATP-binding cassette domain-containing protein [Actinophytocola sp.]|nr:ATP-binding cassette domain-containing protein [Actinophytocola sp.]
MTAAGDVPALECAGLTKSFGGIPVLRGVSLRLEAGAVTALVGENGAGKSTAMKIAAGQLKADTGSVTVNGTGLHRADPGLARQLGVAIVPQELAPIEDMTVYENLFLGRELRSRTGLLDRRGMIADARHLLDEFAIDVDPTTKMRRLSVAMSQIVEIAKATSWGAKVIMLDEPTSAIPEREVARLYDVMARLRDDGVAMLYTTHKMDEIRAIADRVVVLRDGALVLDRPVVDTTDEEIVQATIGRDLDDLFPSVPAPRDDVALEIDDLHVVGFDAPISFSVRRGEILGLAGLVGAGRTELLEAIFGKRATVGGQVRVAGKPVKRSPAASINAGMALVPEDRKGAGLVLSMNVLDNGSLPRLAHFSAAGWLRQRHRRRAVGDAMTSVALRSRGLTQPTGTLSGGNQQKVVLARWLTEPVDVLLLDEPTRGVDVGARSEIYRIIAQLAASGMAVVLASSDMPEVLGLSHRILVLRSGAVAGGLDGDAITAPDVQRTIFHLAAGFDPETGEPEATPQLAKEHRS